LAFLDENGYHKTAQKLEHETNLKQKQSNSKQMLRKILQMSIKDVSTALDPTLTSLEHEGIEGDTEIQQFDYQPTAFEQEEASDFPDVNIWEEGPSTLSNMVLSEDSQRVVSATFNKLIEFITSGGKDLSARQIVMATYQSWTTPEKFLEKFIQRYHVPDWSTSEQEPNREKYVNSIRLQVFVCLKYWIATHQADFNNDRVLNQLRDFIENRVAVDRPDLVTKRFRSDLAALTESQEEEFPQVDLAKCPDPKVPKNIFSPLLTLDDVPREEIARQLTIIDNHLFYRINTVDFLCKNWTKASHGKSAVAAIINRFNQIVKWVVTSVLEKKKYKERAKTIISFLEIARHLQGMQSYNSMAAIYYGITHVSVYRLSHTFNELPSETRRTLTNISNFLNPVGGYANYKAEYAVAKPPCIPFLGAHLQEIAFIEESVPDICGEGMVNFSKRVLLYECIQTITRYSKILYSFLPVKQISSFLTRFKLLKNENDMYKQSLLLEPKGISTTDLVEYEESTSTIQNVTIERTVSSPV